MASPTDLLTPITARRGLWSLGNVTFVGEPSLVREVLEDTNGRFGKGGKLLSGEDGHGGIAGYIGPTSLFTTDDPEMWRRVNAVVRPFFTPRRLASVGAMIADLWAAEMDTWDLRRPVPMYERHTAFSVTFLLRHAFGFADDHDRHEVDETVEAAFGVFAEMAVCLPASLVSPRLADRLDRGARGAFDTIVYRIIARAKADPGDDLIGGLVTAQRSDPALTDEVIRDQVFGLLVAGFDSVSAVFSMAVRRLATTPAELDVLRAEVRDVLGGRRPTFDDVAGHALPRTEAFVVRMTDLHPAFPLFPLHVGRDTVLGGVPLPAGRNLVVDLLAQARILEARGVAHAPRPTPGSPYTPYGAGPRHCTAKHLAHLMLVQTVVMLVQRSGSLSLPVLARVLTTRYAMTLSAGRKGATWVDRRGTDRTAPGRPAPSTAAVRGAAPARGAAPGQG